ncbi:MAG: hypothetical protein GX591_08355 [Planctomycetes bacterium]|nr:hypothetical protein [Planctomycetota bacterium]
MTRLLQNIRAYLPVRRRRRWQYVSGRRRRRGLVLAVVLVAAIYAWWHFTNNARIRRDAVAYLERLTGAQVRIQDASFSLLGGIELAGVRVFTESDGKVSDIFHARQVRLEHAPLSLLRAGRLKVTEIVCVEPVLILIENVDRRRWNWEDLHFPTGVGPGGGGTPDLPVIRMRDGRVQRREIYHGVTVPLGSEPLSAQAVPTATAGEYRVEIFGSGGAENVRAEATFRLDPMAFRWRGGIPVTLLERTLPHGYRQWWDQYQVKGSIEFEGQSDADPASGRAAFKLTDASMVFPHADGDIRLDEVNGRIELTASGIEIQSVTGRLPQLDNILVSLTGRFGGYERTGPVELEFQVDDVRFPLRADHPLMRRLINRFESGYSPVGSAAVTVRLNRDADERIRYRLTARPKGMRITPAVFAAALEDVTGELSLDEQRVTITELTGRWHDAPVTITGWGAMGGGKAFDLRVRVDDGLLGDPFRKLTDASSLQIVRQRVRRYHDRFDPRGPCDVDARVWADEEGRFLAELDLTFDGRASVAYEGFPYRIEGLAGLVKVRPREVSFHDLEGRRGTARIRLGGSVDLTGGQESPDLTLQAVDLPLDDHLGQALVAMAEQAGRQYEHFDLDGSIDVAGRIRRDGDNPFSYDLTASLKNVALTFDQCPYALEDVVGELRLRPEAIEIRNLVGRHGPGRIDVTGRVDGDLAAGEPPAVEIRGAGVRVDEALRRAVVTAGPPGVEDVWTQLQPTGIADFVWNPHREVSLEVVARDMGITFAPFPYPLRQVRGTVLVRRDRIDLEGITAARDGGSLKLDGTVRVGGGRLREADLVLDATGVAITEELLASVPRPLRVLTDHLSPGGRFDVSLSRLRFNDSEPVTAPATADAAAGGGPSWTWEVDGSVHLDDAVATGTFEATAIRAGIAGSVRIDDARDALSVDAALTDGSLHLWDRPVERLGGTIRKAVDDPRLRLERLEGSFCGGRMAGNLTIRLEDIVGCTADLVVEDIQLEQLLVHPDDADDPSARPSGKLRGRLDLAHTFGRSESREGSGRFEITEARIAEVPVFLDLVNVAFLQLPVESVFSTGTVVYYIKGDTLRCETIDLRGETRGLGGLLPGEPTSIVGTGTLDLKTEWLNLIFRSGPPHLFHGPGAELWTLTTRGLHTTHVTGPWRDPEKKTVPFSQLAELLREMSGGE